MGSSKGLSTIWQVVLGITLLAVVGGGVFGAVMWFNQGTANPGQNDGQTDDQTPDQTQTAKWKDNLVKLNIQGRNLSNDNVDKGTIYIYKEKPANWKDEQNIETSDAYDSYSVESDGTTTIQDFPGTYYVVFDNSANSDYMAFKKVTIPDGSSKSVSLSDYNSEPDAVRIDVKDRYSLGSKSVDLGVSSNTTSTTEKTGDATYSPDDNTEYHLQNVVVMPGDQDSSSNSDDPTTDSDNDGTYDMGVSESYVEVTGAVGQSSAKSETFFKPGSGIDMLGADDKATLTFADSLVFNSDNKLSVEFGVTSKELEDGSSISTDDEKLSDGENVWDYQFVDDAGNTNSVAGVNG